MLCASSDNPTAAFSEDHSRFVATETKTGVKLNADMNLTRSDVRCLRIKTRNSHQTARSARKVDKKGRYMRDIMKQSECFENFFSLTETGSK